MFKSVTRVGRRFQATNAGKIPLKSKNRAVGTAIALTSAGFITGYLVSTRSISQNVPSFLFPPGSKTSLEDLCSPEYLDPRFQLDSFKKKLCEIVQEDDLSFSQTDIDDHSFNNYTLHKPKVHERPFAIVYPHDTKHVSEIMKLCYEYGVPVIPFSGGTSIEGQFVSTRNIKQDKDCVCAQQDTVTVVIDFNKHMNKIIQINENDLDCVVQPGVVAKDLNEHHLEKLGLLFGPDGAPGCEIGGQIGTSCSGTNAFRYGTMKENVVNMTVVMADGTIIKTRQRPKKSSNGYNLTGLFIGSEGTLGIVTEATVKLHVKPVYETISIVS